MRFALLALHKFATKPQTVYAYTYTNNSDPDVDAEEWWRFEGVFSRLSKAKACLRAHLEDYWDYANRVKQDELEEEARYNWMMSCGGPGSVMQGGFEAFVRHIEELLNKKYKSLMAGEDGAEDAFDLNIDVQYTQELNFGMGTAQGHYKCKEKWVEDRGGVRVEAEMLLGSCEFYDVRPFIVTMPPPGAPSVRASDAAYSALESVLAKPELFKIIASFLRLRTVHILYISPPPDDYRSCLEMWDRIVGVYATKKQAEDARTAQERDGSPQGREEGSIFYLEEFEIDKEPDNTRSRDKKLRAKRHPMPLRMDRLPNGVPAWGADF